MKRYLGILLLIGLLLPGCLLADGSDVVSTTIEPWNGFWWPSRDGGMITGFARPSFHSINPYPDWTGFFAPLEKYSLAFNEDPRGPLWQFEFDHDYAPDGPSWGGHCNGWAAAAILEPEPRETGELNGIYFRVGDKKALLTELHQRDAFNIRFFSNTDDAAMFHQTLIQYLKVMDKPMVIETDSGEEVWNYPVYKYDMSWTDEGNIRHVTTNLYLARDGVNPDSLTEIPRSDSVPYTLTYDLTLDGGQIVSGVWTGDSVTQHPQFLWEPIPQPTANPYLDANRVQEIVASTIASPVTDDGLEPNNQTLDASPLVFDDLMPRLLDPDYFEVPVEAGESVDVGVYLKKLDITGQAALFDGNGQPVSDVAVEPYRTVFHAGLQSTDSTLLLSVTPDDGPQTNSRNYGIEVTRSSEEYFMPHVATADGWNTLMFLLNPGTTTDRLFFHFYRTTDGQVEKNTFQNNVTELAPQTMCWGPLESFFVDYLPDNESWMKIRTDGDLRGIFLFENESVGGNLATMPLQAQGARTLFLNHLAVDTLWWTGVSIANTNSYQPAHVTLQAYAESGEAVGDTLSLTIPGGGRKIDMLANLLPADTLSRAGWIRIDSDRDVTGFELFGTNDLSLFEGIPLQTRTGTDWIVPWVPGESGWWTGISIVNPGTTSVTVEIKPINSDGMNVYGLMNPQTKTITLTPGQKWVRLVGDVFPDPLFGPIAWLDIHATQPVTGFTLYGNYTQGILCGHPLADATEMASDGFFPWVEGTSLVVSNALGQNRTTLTLEALDADGNILASGEAASLGVKMVQRIFPESILGGPVPNGTVYLHWSCDRALSVLQEIIQQNRGTVLSSMNLSE